MAKPITIKIDGFYGLIQDEFKLVAAKHISVLEGIELNNDAGIKTVFRIATNSKIRNMLEKGYAVFTYGEPGSPSICHVLNEAGLIHGKE